MRSDIVLTKPLENTILTVNISVEKIFFARLWLGKELLKLAARVLGCGIEFK